MNQHGYNIRWTLAKGAKFIQDTMYPVARGMGLHLGLAGSVLRDGASYNDLDVMVMRYNNEVASEEDLLQLASQLPGQWLEDAEPSSVPENRRRAVLKLQCCDDDSPYSGHYLDLISEGPG